MDTRRLAKMGNVGGLTPTPEAPPGYRRWATRLFAEEAWWGVRGPNSEAVAEAEEPRACVEGVDEPEVSSVAIARPSADFLDLRSGEVAHGELGGATDAQAVGAKNRWVESHRRDCLLHKVKECAVGEGGTEQVDLKEGVGGGLTGGRHPSCPQQVVRADCAAAFEDLEGHALVEAIRLAVGKEKVELVLFPRDVLTKEDGAVGAFARDFARPHETEEAQGGGRSQSPTQICRWGRQSEEPRQDGAGDRETTRWWGCGARWARFGHADVEPAETRVVKAIDGSTNVDADAAEG